MDRQIVKVGSTIVNLANVTHAKIYAEPAKPLSQDRYEDKHICVRDEGKDLWVRVVLYVNAMSANDDGVPTQQKIVFKGEDAELLRKYFDRLAFDLIKRSTNHTGNASREAEVPA